MRRSVILICLVVGGCYGPLHTCRTDCQSGYERNIFCECEKIVPPGQGSPWHPPQGPVAGRDFIWRSSQNCTSNTIVFLTNNFGTDVLAIYSYRNSNTRVRNKITVKPYTRSYEDAVKNGSVLGYNYLDNKECTLVDYQLESSSAAFSEQYPEEESALKSLLERSRIETSQTLRNLQSRNLTTKVDPAVAPNNPVSAEPYVVRRKVKILNCPQECNEGGTPTIWCIKGTPPDQSKVRAIQQQLMQPLSENIIGIGQIQKLVGQPNECNRQDIKATPNMLLNNGEACVFPFYFNSTDTVPSIVVHYPTTVSANRVDKQNLSVIEFKAPAETPTLQFRNKDINEIWGGRIIQIAADAKGVYYQTTGGCIALEIK
jgi:hypothetical protein